MTAATVVTILLVEDNRGDAELIMEQVRRQKFTNPIDHVLDGAAAISYLTRALDEGALPDLVLVDLNLPVMDGRDVLRWVRSHEHPTIRTLPVIILTSSDVQGDVQESYALGASAYVVKPVGMDGFKTIVSALEGFWFSVVRLPPR